MISIHAPRVGSDSANSQGSRQPWNFNPRSPCGERRKILETIKDGKIFQSTLPVWGATIVGATTAKQETFQSTLPVWGATRNFVCNDHIRGISIHAPRVGSDMAHQLCFVHRGISIHAPRVGSDLVAVPHFLGVVTFQSTLPVWGATAPAQIADFNRNYFNPRSPCGERRGVFLISRPRCHFNPRSPCGERRHIAFNAAHVVGISIHAPRVGSDCAGI